MTLLASVLNISIRKLDPKMDADTLRVGGRLGFANMPNESKHPAILPKYIHVSMLILRDTHRAFLHSGRNHMLSSMRRKGTLGHKTNYPKLQKALTSGATNDGPLAG